MLGDIAVCENIYIACGYTDMRKSIDGLAAVVQQQFHLDPFSNSLFLFCGRHRNTETAQATEQHGCGYKRRDHLPKFVVLHGSESFFTLVNNFLRSFSLTKYHRSKQSCHCNRNTHSR